MQKTFTVWPSKKRIGQPLFSTNSCEQENSTTLLIIKPRLNKQAKRKHLKGRYGLQGP